MTPRIAGALAAAALGALAAPGGAASAGPHPGHGGGKPGAHGIGHGAAAPPAATVGMGAAAFAPARVDVLAGEAVRWQNASGAPHTVTARDGSWDSGPVTPGEIHEHTMPDVPGSLSYLCRLHPGMAGEIAIHRLLLDRRPEPAAPGRAFALTGRAALAAGTPVTVEADAGAGFVPVASALVGADGRFAAPVRPAGATTYRAVAGSEASPPVAVAVLARAVRTSVRRQGRRTTVTASVVPASPGATVVLQLRLPERFGWWPSARRRLDAHSRARWVLSPRRSVPARVVLTLPDGATVLAQSRTWRLRGSRR